jgi:hypothetical protein
MAYKVHLDSRMRKAMASSCDITVGMKIADPNWQVMCMILASDAMQAMAYLESSRPDMALESLRNAKRVIDLTMMVKTDLADRTAPAWEPQITSEG